MNAADVPLGLLCKFLKRLYPKLQGEDLLTATHRLGAVATAEYPNDIILFEIFNDFLCRLNDTVTLRGSLSHNALIPIETVIGNCKITRDYVHGLKKLNQREHPVIKYAEGYITVGENGAVTASLGKLAKYRNSEFDETFKLELKYTNLPEGKKLRIIIQELE